MLSSCTQLSTLVFGLLRYVHLQPNMVTDVDVWFKSHSLRNCANMVAEPGRRTRHDGLMAENPQKMGEQPADESPHPSSNCFFNM